MLMLTGREVQDVNCETQVDARVVCIASDLVDSGLDIEYLPTSSLGKQ